MSSKVGGNCVAHLSTAYPDDPAGTKRKSPDLTMAGIIFCTAKRRDTLEPLLRVRPLPLPRGVLESTSLVDKTR
jgi:hypothetical protein